VGLDLAVQLARIAGSVPAAVTSGEVSVSPDPVSPRIGHPDHRRRAPGRAVGGRPPTTQGAAGAVTTVARRRSAGTSAPSRRPTAGRGRKGR